MCRAVIPWIRSLGLVAGLVVLLSGCLFEGGFPGEAPPDGQMDGQTDGKTGAIVFSIPPVAPWVVREKPDPVSRNPAAGYAGASGVPRAWMRADRVRLELYVGTTLDRYFEWEPSSPVASGEVLTGSWTRVPARTYATLRVLVFNNAVSATAAVVSGQVADLTVSANRTTNVTVTCFPVTTVSLSENTWSAVTSLAVGAEQWFRVTTPYDSTRFWINSVSGDMDLYVFRPDGTGLGSETGTAAEAYIDLPTPSDPSYLCMYAHTAGSGRVMWGTVESEGAIDVTIR